ncbi:MAG TPA: heavy metal-binding domain-containing protein [Hyphomicrobiales bacterium]|nr:heavy metal-binding domain-containing protein [Hyphomicrobiales bacterium]
MQLYTVESLSGRRIEEGELLYANAVLAANLLRDIREAITNALGGNMRRYERVLDRVTAQAIELLKAKAAEKGYDGIVAVRITNPFMVQGSAGITIYGTGFNFIRE